MWHEEISSIITIIFQPISSCHINLYSIIYTIFFCDSIIIEKFIVIMVEKRVGIYKLT